MCRRQRKRDFFSRYFRKTSYFQDTTLTMYVQLTNPVSAEIVIDAENLSCFGANSPNFSSSFTGYEGLDSASLLEVFKYALVVGPVAYSSQLKNGTVLKTLTGKDITVTVLGDDIYLDSSKVIIRDYITANGVVQVLDR